MKTAENWLSEYAESHQNKLNKLIHWICVPLIVFSIFGLILCLPFPFEKTWMINWSTPVLLGILIFYFRLSKLACMCFLSISLLILKGNWALYALLNYSSNELIIVSFAIFTTAWIGQFIGHHIEGKKPSFFKDIQFLLIGPLWLMSQFLKSINIKMP